MSNAEEDTELRELVTEALEKNGVLSEVRARLRAGVFLALEREHERRSSAPLQDVLGSRDGPLALLLVQELLDFCQLRHTSSVYRAETGQPASLSYRGREAIVKDYKLNSIGDDQTDKTPLLVRLIGALFNKPPNKAPQDNYDTTFTSDSTSISVPDEKNKVILKLNLNRSSESDKSSPNNKSPRSENSINNDTRIELHTDSEKSVNSDSDSVGHSKLLENNESHPITSALSHYNKTVENNSLDSITEIDKSNKTVQDVSESIKISSEVTDQGQTAPNHTKNHSSQCSNRSDLSEESIQEEIISYDNDFEDESNIINKLTASSILSLNYSMNDEQSKTSISQEAKSVLDESIPESPNTKQKVMQYISKLRNSESKTDKSKSNEMKSISKSNQGNGAPSNGLLQNLHSIDSEYSSETLSSHTKINGTE